MTYHIFFLKHNENAYPIKNNIIKANKQKCIKLTIYYKYIHNVSKLQ